MATKFEKFGQSMSYAVASLTTAAVGLSISTLASMNPVTAAAVSPALVILTFEVSKKLMTVAYGHLNEALKIQEAENVKPTPGRKLLS
jgi:hypothetical protein